MMVRLSALLVILMILIISSFGEVEETRERTKTELCSDCYASCRDGILLLEKIIRLLGYESQIIQEQTNEVDHENKVLLREIKILRFKLANPTTLFVPDPMPIKSSLISQPGSLGYPGFYGNCEDLLKCLNDTALAKDWISSWEEKNIRYQSRIEFLQAENFNLTSLQAELNQQLLTQQNSNN